MLLFFSGHTHHHIHFFKSCYYFCLVLCMCVFCFALFSNKANANREKQTLFVFSPITYFLLSQIPLKHPMILFTSLWRFKLLQVGFCRQHTILQTSRHFVFTLQRHFKTSMPRIEIAAFSTALQRSPWGLR